MQVELDKYYGQWYEAARLPNWFQGDAWFSLWSGVRATALYEPRMEAKTFSVTNMMTRKFKFPFLENIFSKNETIEGEASIEGENSFSVSFNFFSKLFTFGKPNYFVRSIIEDENGEYLFSVVTSDQGNDEQKFAWLLSKKDPEQWTENELALAKSTIQLMELCGVKEEKLIKHSVFP